MNDDFEHMPALAVFAGEGGPCAVCGEHTYNDVGAHLRGIRLCRECDLDYLFATWARCRCGAEIYNPDCGPIHHEPTCPSPDDYEVLR